MSGAYHYRPQYTQNAVGPGAEEESTNEPTREVSLASWRCPYCDSLGLEHAPNCRVATAEEVARQWILTKEHPPASELYAILAAYAAYAVGQAASGAQPDAWRWTDTKEDHLESLANNADVLIKAHQLRKLTAPAMAQELSEGEAYQEAGKYELEIAKVIGDYEVGKYRIPIVKIIHRALLRSKGGWA